MTSTAAADDWVYFADPPLSIGRVTNSHTSLRSSIKPRSFGNRLLMGFGLGFGVTLLPVLLMLIGSRKADAFALCVAMFILISIFVVPVAIGLVFYFTRFRHFCGFVGEYGTAYFTCAGSPKRLVRKEIFQFRDAEELRIGRTHEYHNGTYALTAYWLRWSDRAGRTIYLFQGTHNAGPGELPVADPDEFGRAAENEWSRGLLTRAIPEIEQGGTAVFPIGKREAVQFRRNGMVIDWNGKHTEFAAGDIIEARVRDGVIAFKQPGASEGWFTSPGVHYLPYQDTANVQVLLTLMKELHGVALTS